MPVLAQPRATARMRAMYVGMSSPSPPCAVGTVPASRPSRQSARQLSIGLAPATSYWLARGAIVSRVTRSARSRIVLFISSPRTPGPQPRDVLRLALPSLPLDPGRGQCAPDAAGKKQDERHEDHADHDRPGLDDQAQAIGQDQEGRRANEGAEERPGAAQQRHD